MISKGCPLSTSLVRTFRSCNLCVHELTKFLESGVHGISRCFFSFLEIFQIQESPFDSYFFRGGGKTPQRGGSFEVFFSVL